MRSISALLVLTPIAMCQSFEVATVKPGAPGDFGARGGGGPGTNDPTRYFVENYPLASLLEIAYGIRSWQLYGPSWLDSERFTVTAKVPAGITKEQLNLMMRNLLIERFRVATHFEKKDVAGYRLVVARRGPRLAAPAADPQQNDDPEKPAAPFQLTLDEEGYPRLPPGRHYAMAMANDRARWRFVDESMEDFAGTLGDQIRQPVVNATGLTGTYDFLVSWSYAAIQPGAPADSGPSIFAAIEEQLGLKLESHKVPVDKLVIDRIERVPSDN